MGPGRPVGLPLNRVSGILSGTPGSVTAAALYTVTATNTGGTTGLGLTISVVTAPTITAFAPATNPVNYGDSVALNWTLGGGAPTVLTLDGLSVLGSSTSNVLPVRRQSYALAASNVAGSASATTSVAARGVDLLAGTLVGPGSVDGSATVSRFYLPAAVAMDGAGTFYVADKNNHTIRKVTAAGAVSTLAGSGGLSGSTDGTGSGARFKNPSALALDGSGNLFVADSGNQTIRKVSPAGVVTTLAGSPGNPGSTDGTGGGALFNTPAGVAVDGSGNVFVSDSLNHTLRKVASGGVVTTFAGSAGAPGSLDGTGIAASFDTPTGLAIDGSGNLYVADSLNHTIRKVSSLAVVGTLAGMAGTPGSTDATGLLASFNTPTGVAVDGSGNVYVGDKGNDLVRKVTSGGVVSTLAGIAGSAGSQDGSANVEFNQPQGLVMDGSGNLVIADSGNHVLRKLTAGGTASTLAGGVGPGSGDGSGGGAGFYGPLGVGVDASGNAYVADTRNATLRTISTLGATATLAGSAGTPGSSDGSGAAARFNGPDGVAVDASGLVYVADTANHTIRKITSSGAVGTLAGSPGTFGTTDGTGTSARFTSPQGVAVDSSGNVYVADTGNHTIRKITPAGAVTTFAGMVGAPGGTDATGTAAQFNAPEGVAVDTAGNVYVADTGNHTIRKITSAGVVTTLAGTASAPGYIDATGPLARFLSPHALTVNAAGTLFVADTGNHTIRKVTAGGVVTTAGGQSLATGPSPGLLPSTLGSPKGIAITSNGDLLITTGNGVIQLTAPF